MHVPVAVLALGGVKCECECESELYRNNTIQQRIAEMAQPPEDTVESNDIAPVQIRLDDEQPVLTDPDYTTVIDEWKKSQQKFSRFGRYIQPVSSDFGNKLMQKCMDSRNENKWSGKVCFSYKICPIQDLHPYASVSFWMYVLQEGGAAIVRKISEAMKIMVEEEAHPLPSAAADKSEEKKETQEDISSGVDVGVLPHGMNPEDLLGKPVTENHGEVQIGRVVNMIVDDNHCWAIMHMNKYCENANDAQNEEQQTEDGNEVPCKPETDESDEDSPVLAPKYIRQKNLSEEEAEAQAEAVFTELYGPRPRAKVSCYYIDKDGNEVHL